MNKKYYVYVLLTVNNTLYCGYTDNIEKRYKLHCEGKGAKYTKVNKPLTIVYTQEFESKSLAMKEEIRIKKLTRKQKEKLIYSKSHSDNNLSNVNFFLI